MTANPYLFADQYRRGKKNPVPVGAFLFIVIACRVLCKNGRYFPLLCVNSADNGDSVPFVSPLRHAIIKGATEAARLVLDLYFICG